MAAERPHQLTFYVFLLACAIIIPLALPFWVNDAAGFFKEVMAEAHGVLLDILIIGWLLFWVRKQGERRLVTQRYREEIEDYLGWRAPEATLRIAGNIRRLNRLGVRIPLTLTEAYLKGANLTDVNLEEADLWGADLTSAKLVGARLSETNLAGALLQEADLERATLIKADLRGANLTEADLERAFLEEADLRGATLTGADLQFASMPGANLERARLIGANLRGAHLEHANLRGADFEGANLHGASLDGARIADARFADAVLERTDLTGAVLPEGEELLALFAGARSLEGAKLDPGVEQTLREGLPRLFAPVLA